MHRRFALVALVLALAGIARLPAGAQDAAPTAGVPLDLAAALLRPDDIASPSDPGVGIAQGVYEETLERYLAGLGSVAEDQRSELRAGLETAGWQRRHVGVVERRSGDPPAIAVRYVVAITEYATAEGAAAGFALTEAEVGEPDAEDLPTARAVGDQSEVTRGRRRATAGGPGYRYVNATARVDNLIADVNVQDFAGTRPTPDEAIDLVETQLDRIAEVQAGAPPGLSVRAARLEGPGTALDGYLRLGGSTFRLATDSEAEAAAREASFGAASAAYAVRQPLPSGSLYDLLLLGFPDAEAAAGFLRAAPAAVPGSTPPAGVGEEAVGLPVRVERPEVGTVEGYAVLTRVGATVARIELSGPTGPPPPAVVAALAAAQAACLGADGPCGRVPPPAEVAAVPAPAG
jgi:hypothetical protein